MPQLSFFAVLQDFDVHVLIENKCFVQKLSLFRHRDDVLPKIKTTIKKVYFYIFYQFTHNVVNFSLTFTFELVKFDKLYKKVSCSFNVR